MEEVNHIFTHSMYNILSFIRVTSIIIIIYVIDTKFLTHANNHFICNIVNDAVSNADDIMFCVLYFYDN